MIVRKNVADNNFLFFVGAAAFRGQDTLKNMRETIEAHVHDSKNTMFQQAVDVMLNQLSGLRVCYILSYVIL